MILSIRYASNDRKTRIESDVTPRVVNMYETRTYFPFRYEGELPEGVVDLQWRQQVRSPSAHAERTAASRLTLSLSLSLCRSATTSTPKSSSRSICLAPLYRPCRYVPTSPLVPEHEGMLLPAAGCSTGEQAGVTATMWTFAWMPMLLLTAC